MVDAADLERIVVDVLSDEAEELSRVVHRFRVRCGLRESETRDLFLAALDGLLRKAAPVKLGKVTKKPRPDLVRAELENIQMQFLDRASEGWSNVTLATWADLVRRWPEGAAPPEGVRLRSVEHSQGQPDYESMLFESMLFESIPPEPTPFPAVARNFRARSNLGPADARTKIFATLSVLLLAATEQHGAQERKSLADVAAGDIEVRFTDRLNEGWTPLNGYVLVELMDRWPSHAELPRDDVLLKRSLFPARINEQALKIA